MSVYLLLLFDTNLLLQIGSLALWGFAATIVMTTIMSLAQEVRVSRMSLPFMLGSMVTPDRDRAQLMGFIGHMVNGWFIALLYGFIFESWGQAGWWQGASIGFVHGLFILTFIIPALPGIHPRMASERHGPTPTRQLQPPGFMGRNYGWSTPVVTLAAHIVYGAILGGLYVFVQY